MTPAERQAKRRAKQSEAGNVLLRKWVPAALRADIEEMADRMVKEWEQREGGKCSD